MEDFTMLFEKLADVSSEVRLLPGADATTIELDEIAELRRVVLEITQPTPVSYVTT